MRSLLSRIKSWYAGHVVPVWISSLVLILVLLYLAPSIIITVPSGFGGVLWRRFDYFGLVADGTETRWSYNEGTHWKLPWDKFFLYDLRLQNITTTFPVLMNDGLQVQAEVTVRFRPLQIELGDLQKYVGQDYRERLVIPELLAHARTEMSKLSPDELYSSRRRETEDAIFRNLTEEFVVRFKPDDTIFGVDGHLRQRIVAILADESVPLSTQAIADRLGVEPAGSVTRDLAALVADDLIRRTVVNGQAEFRINSERLAEDGQVNHLTGSGRSLIYVEDVLIRNIELPAAITTAIQRKLTVQQEMLEYDYRVQKEAKESERKKIEAQGIREFQDIVTGGISDRYLKWKGIDATLALANSPNSKVVVIGSKGDGLPIILGPLETTNAPESAHAPAAAPNSTPAKPPATPAKR